MPRGRILVVDDEQLIRWSVREALSQAGHSVYEAETGQAALGTASNLELDLAMLDLKLPDTDGITLMKQLLEKNPSLTVIIMTAYSSVETAVQAMKLGAYDYLSKPFNIDELALTVNRALESVDLKREVTSIHSDLKSRYALQNIVGKSAAIQEVQKLIRKVAQSEANTIMLRGESGVGKDLVARAIHYESRRADKPFMTITCTTLQETLLESELFGHEKGAFTDARTQKRGLFEMAHGGTVFLDEIGDISPTLQSKLLHFLEHKSFRRVGGTEDLKVDVRVIAATNRDLEQGIRDGKFREDLYYRLNIIPIYIPALRERQEDVTLLASHFVQLFSREFKKPAARISRDAMDALTRYSWPGNVRELRNVIERATILAPGPFIEPRHLPPTLSHEPPPPHQPQVALAPGTTVEEAERRLIMMTLEHTRDNKTRAAEILGISLKTLHNKLNKLRLRPKKPE
jgi:DNA-binding NtrC family response regulator